MFLRLFLLLAAFSSVAAEPLRTKNVLFITTDGLRWQEVFRGAEEALLNKANGGIDAAVLSKVRRQFWRATDHESAVRSIAGQDIEQLAPYVDVISPMTYHKLCYQPTAWIEQVIADFHRRTGKPILPIVQSLDLPTPIFVEEFDDALAKGLDAPTEGVMIFTLEPLVSDASKQDIVRTRFK